MSVGGKVTPGWDWAMKQEEERNKNVLTLQLPQGGGPLHLRRIPAGSFRMGSRDITPVEEPILRVQVPEFYLGIFPVTQTQYGAWANQHKNHFDNAGEFYPGLLPAESLDWKDCLSFSDWLSKSVSGALPKGFGPNLPTEAHWEYACRARSETEYASGDGEGALRQMGWFEQNSGSRTHAVGELERNEWDLFDLHGNVWEWCSDDWDKGAYRTRIDGAEAVESRSSSPNRVLRGGSWIDSALWCRSAFRYWRHAGFRIHFQGFRVCLLPGPVDQARQRLASLHAGTEAKERAGEGGGTPTERARDAAVARRSPLSDLRLPKIPDDPTPQDA